MEKNLTRENRMGTMPVGKLVVSMSLPIIISMLVQALYNVVDSVFVSMINQEALNAVSLAFPAQNLMIGFATGMAVGVNALVSRALGAKDSEYANHVARNGVLLAILCYLLFLLFGLFGTQLFFSLQTKNTAVLAYGRDYLTIVCGMSFGLFGQCMFERLLQSTGKTIYTMISQGTGAIINIIFDPIFIFVFKMGVAGAALATVLGQIVGCIIGIIFNHKKNTDIQLSFKSFRPNGRIIGHILGIGIPSVIMVAVGSLMTFVFNIILYAYTTGMTYAQNVFGIYFKLNSLIFMPIFGLNNGIVPIVAFNYGARRKDRLMQAVKYGVAFAVGLMVIGVLLFLLIPDKLLGIFITNATADEIKIMMSIGVPALRIICTHFLLAAVSISLSSVFQALGRGVYSMIMSIARQLVILLPAAYLLARLGQTVGNDNLVWISFPIAEVVGITLALVFFRRVYRQMIQPLDRVPEPVAQAAKA